MPEAHAMLGPSGSKRWLTCTPSALLEAAVPDQGSIYAAEGTRAHAAAEQKLKQWLKEGRWDPVPLSPEDLASGMQEYTDNYVSYVIEAYEAEKKDCPDALLMVEQKLDYSRWVPKGWGTGDACIISDSCLHVIDLKYGQGVEVDAEDNPQLKMYAAGAISRWGTAYLFDQVTVHIFQPRKNNIASDTFTVQEIEDWMETYVKPRAEMAAKGEGEFQAGDHCQFCRIRQECKAYHQYHLDLIEPYKNENGVLKKGDALTPEDVAKIFPQLKQIKSWAEGLEAWALDQALEGVKFPGLKLVAGRSNRVITDLDQAVQLLKDAGYTDDDLYEPKKPKALTKLENVVGKKKFPKILGNLISKPPGKPALVLASDERPELDMAMNDFAEEIERG